MNRQDKNLSALLPYGQLASRYHLIEKGFSSHTLDNYLKSGKLVKVVPGFYKRPESRLSWQAVVASLPDLVNGPVTAGGLTSLELQGFAQYLSLNNQHRVHLYSPESCSVRLKQVFRQMDVELCWHTTGRLWKKGWPDADSLRQYQWREDAAAMVISSPEQSILELLMGVPEETSFDHAEQLMQGLTQLSPKRLDAPLHECKNVKVKRLFFWLADRFQYPWRKKLDEHDYDLGSGKRVVAEGGKLDKRYNITVPKELSGEQLAG